MGIYKARYKVEVNMMHDPRKLYSETENRVADSVVSPRKPVMEASSMKWFGETTNKENKMTMIVEPMEKGLVVLSMPKQRWMTIQMLIWFIQICNLKTAC